MKDFTNRLIRADDTLAYPVRRGARMWMEKARVLGFETRSDGVKTIKAIREDTRRVTLLHPENCIIIKDF